MELEIFNQTEEEIKELETVRKVLEYACSKEKLGKVCFNVIIVDNDYIHELNKNYRNIDRVTDVITFALEDEKDIVEPNGVRYGHSLLRELSFLAVHGFYHLLGYDHMNKEEEVIMFQKQEEVLHECKIER